MGLGIPSWFALMTDLNVLLHGSGRINKDITAQLQNKVMTTLQQLLIANKTTRHAYSSLYIVSLIQKTLSQNIRTIV